MSRVILLFIFSFFCQVIAKKFKAKKGVSSSRPATRRQSTKRNFREIKEEVCRKFGPKGFDSFLTHLKKNPPSLWGEIQPLYFLERNLVLALYHDQNNIGYDKILKLIDHGLSFGHNSFQNNTKKIRKAGRVWGESTVNLGGFSDWKVAMQSMKKLKGPFKDVQALLFQDSVDFCLQKKSDRGPSSSFWSGKIHKPACQFQVIQNCKGQVVKAWGGYSPKIMDSYWLELKQKWIRTCLQGATIVGDTHYSVGKTLFKDPVYITKVNKPRPETKNEETAITKKQKQVNSSIDAIRACVEHPFAWMKNHFKVLTVAFAEEPEQLDAAVWTAIGAYNHTKVD